MSVQVVPVAGPVPAGVGFDLAAHGWVEEERFLTGTATAYDLVGDRGADGRWAVHPGETAAFTTRVLVRRPEDPAAFSGTVVVEWLNVSGGLDAAPDWTLLHRHLLRRGDAWVGVSAQKVGIEGGGAFEGMHLKKAHPDRYAALDHPGDRWSFEIFGQAGLALRERPQDLLGPLVPGQLLAQGESQSAMFLTTYVNAVDQVQRVFDGFFLHGRGAAGASLGVGGLARGTGPGEAIRADARVPVLVLQSETDVIVLGSARVDQPDGDRVRQWEIAGAAHADTYLLVAGAIDDGTLSPDRLADLLAPTSELAIGTTATPINSGPQQHYVGQAAYDHLVRWAAGGAAPPVVPRLQVSPDGHDLVRDHLGIAVGGLRSPWVDEPTVVLSGLGQEGEAFAILFGTTKPVDPAHLWQRHPDGHGAHLAAFERQLDGAIGAGAILGEDRAEILELATLAVRGAWSPLPDRGE